MIIRLIRIIRITLLLLLTTVLHTTLNAEQHTAGKMVPVAPTEGRYGHWLYLPKDYSERGATKYPLLVYLHGSSSRGNDLNRLLRQGPPKHIRAGQHFPFIMAAAQAPAGSNWEPARLKALIEHLKSIHPIDSDRLYLTGLSRGGRGTYKTAAAYPTYFAAIAPMAPWAIDLSLAPKLTQVPIWTFHGDQDHVASFEDASQMVENIRKAGGNIRFTIYKGHGHGPKNGWAPAYADPKLYEWLLAQKRVQSKTTSN